MDFELGIDFGVMDLNFIGDFNSGGSSDIFLRRYKNKHLVWVIHLLNEFK